MKKSWIKLNAFITCVWLTFSIMLVFFGSLFVFSGKEGYYVLNSKENSQYFYI